jgi:hypothetical protein
MRFCAIPVGAAATLAAAGLLVGGAAFAEPDLAALRREVADTERAFAAAWPSATMRVK